MKLTIQISKADLSRLEESGGYNGLTFNVEISYTSTSRLREMRVVRDQAYYESLFKRKKAFDEKIRKQKQLETSDIADFEIEVIRTNKVFYKVLKIEPDDIQRF